MSESKEEVKEEQNQEESLPEPKVVQYCDLCHFPVEYCEYTHELLLKKEVTEEEKQNEEKKEEGKNEETIDTSKKPEGEEKKEGEDKEKKHKKKKEAPTMIVIEQAKRGKKKHTTYVSNLEKFGLVLKDVAKQFSKKFACSCTVTKEDNGTECITLTGEFADDVFEFLTTTFPNIKPENCQVKISKK